MPSRSRSRRPGRSSPRSRLSQNSGVQASGEMKEKDPALVLRRGRDQLVVPESLLGDQGAPISDPALRAESGDQFPGVGTVVVDERDRRVQPRERHQRAGRAGAVDHLLDAVDPKIGAADLVAALLAKQERSTTWSAGYASTRR